MDISKINKRVNNTPDNIKEELDPITDEYIKGLFDSQGDDSNPLDYYTKLAIDNKVTSINREIEKVNTSVTGIDTKVIVLDGEVRSLKQSVSDGKQLVATSLTGKDTPVNGSDSFQQIASGADTIRNNLATTITSKGIEASGTESFDDLNDKVGQINTKPLVAKAGITQVLFHDRTLYAVSEKLNKTVASFSDFNIEGTFTVSCKIQASSGSTMYGVIKHKRGNEIIFTKKFTRNSSDTEGTPIGAIASSGQPYSYTVDVANVKIGDTIDFVCDTNGGSTNMNSFTDCEISCDGGGIVI